MSLAQFIPSNKKDQSTTAQPQTLGVNASFNQILVMRKKVKMKNVCYSMYVGLFGNTDNRIKTNQ